MRYVLLFCVVAGCAVDHTGLGPPGAPLRDAGAFDSSIDSPLDSGADCPTGFRRDPAGECINIDDCAPNPCRNEGTCTDGVNGFRCTCPPKYLGDTCEIEAASCEPNPCMNGGTCALSGDRVTCACPPGFSGATCEMRVDGCTPNPCMNGGTCTNEGASFSCRCGVAFSGPTCATTLPEDQLAFYDPLREQVNPESNPLPVTAVDPRVTASDLENVTHDPTMSRNYNRRPVRMSMGALDPATSFYVTVTLAPSAATDAIALSRVTYSYASYVYGTTGTISVRTSADDFATTVDAQPWTGLNNERLSFDLSAVPPSTGRLEVRLYMHDQSLTGGVAVQDWADLLSTAAGMGDGMRVFGRVVPE